MTIYGHKGGSMRALSGASLAVAAFWRCRRRLAVRRLAQLQAMKAFKAANQAYQQQDYKKAAGLYEEAVAADPNLAQAYFFLGNSYDQQYKPSRKGEAAERRAADQGGGHYQQAADKLSVSDEPGRQEARQAVAGVSGLGLRRRQAQ